VEERYTALLESEGLTDSRFEAAWRAVRAAMPPTPLLPSPALSARAGRPVWLKLEGVTAVRAFKVRGALSKVAELDAAGESGGLVTASAGNHGLAVAYAGRRSGRAVTVYVPAGANPVKVAAIRAEGATVVESGADYQAAAEAALDAVRQGRGLWIHPFDDAAVIAGQATVAQEIAQALPETRQVAAGIGGGGLASGIAAGLARLLPAARLVGVEMVGADSMLRSLAAGHVVTLDKVSTMADGLAPRAVSERTLRLVGTLAEAVVPLEDDALPGAVRWLVERERVLAEPSGAAVVAALLAGLVKGEGPLVLVISGANVSPSDLRRALDSALPDVGA
jgi:threonine dehydratase